MQSCWLAICWLVVFSLASVACGQTPNLSLLDDLNISRLHVSKEPPPAERLVSICLVDAAGTPVVDADVGILLFDQAQGPVWAMGSRRSRGRSAYRSDEDGVVRIPYRVARVERAHLYALAANKQLVGFSQLYGFAKPDKPMMMTLAPACRVTGRYDSPELTSRGESLGVPVETRNDSIQTYISTAAGHPVVQHRSSKTEFEVFLPPGEFSLQATHATANLTKTSVIIPPGMRELDLNTVELRITVGRGRGYVAPVNFYGLPTFTAPDELPFGISTFCFSPDGRILATAHERGRGNYAGVDLWNCQTGGQLYSQRWSQSIFDIDFSPDGKLLAIATDELNVAILDIATKELREFSHEHTRPVICVSFARDTMTLASGSDTEIVIWDASAGVARQKFVGGAFPRGLSLSSDGSLLASSQYGDTTVWDTWSGNQTAKFPGDRLYHMGAILLPDDRTLLSFSGFPTRRRQQGQLRRITIPTGAEAPVLPCDGLPMGVAIDHAGERVAVLTETGLAIWSLRDSEPIGQLPIARVSSPQQLAFSPDGGSLVVSGVNTGLRVFGVNLARAKSKAVPRRELSQPAPAASALAMSPDGKLLASGHASPSERDGKPRKYPLRLWNASDGELLREVPAHQGAVTSVVIAAEGHVCSASESGEIAIHHESGAEIRRWPGHAGPVNQLLLLADPARLVSAGDDGIVRFWNLESGAQLRELTSGPSPILALAATADGRQLFSADGANTIHLWDLSSDKVVQTISTPRIQVRSLAVAPDGKSLAAAGLVSIRTREYMTDFGEIRQWNTSDWSPLPSLRHHGAITSINFSPCGKYLASAGLDPEIKLWLPRNGYHWGTIERDAGSYFSRLLFSPDGTSMITSGATPVTFWTTPEPDPRVLDELHQE